MIFSYFNHQTLFITGASGFVGTALVYRILTRCSPRHTFLLCRGGLSRLRTQWTQHLPPETVSRLLHSPRLTVLDGDLLQPDLGLSPSTRSTLTQHLTVVIHAASSINLLAPLSKLIDPVITATLRVVDLALESPHLTRFAYLSTAYTNAHIYEEQELKPSDPDTAFIHERIYPLSHSLPPFSELALLQSHGSTPAYTSHAFPWPYAYAKHLTERLLSSIFASSSSSSSSPSPLRLLILRPSVIGPSQSFPYPDYSIPTSTPTTMLAAALALTPSLSVPVTSRAGSAEEAENETFTDEVPVDVVVDRLLVHLVAGAEGVVHAVSGEKSKHHHKDKEMKDEKGVIMTTTCNCNATGSATSSCSTICDSASTSTSFRAFWEETMSLGVRVWPWKLSAVWVDCGWRDTRLHQIARLYVVYATTIVFEQGKTEDAVRKMGIRDGGADTRWGAESASGSGEEDLQLVKTSRGFGLYRRRTDVEAAMGRLVKRMNWLVRAAWGLLRRVKSRGAQQEQT